MLYKYLKELTTFDVDEGGFLRGTSERFSITTPPDVRRHRNFK